MTTLPVATTAEQRFGVFRAAFEQAKRALPKAHRQTHYEFAGLPVRLSVVGSKLAERVEIPFAHLRMADPPPLHPTLTIELWDGSEAQAPVPAGLNEPADGGKWMVDGGLLSSSKGGRFISYWRGHSLMWLDRDTDRIIGWIESADQLTLYERTKPLPAVLAQWYRDRRVQIVHAGLVAKYGKGALIAGPNGAGKSTLTLACLCAGFESLGDDHVGLEMTGDGTFVGHSLYNTTRLELQQVRLFPQLVPGTVRDHHEPNEKELIMLAKVFPERLRRSIATDVLVMPRRPQSSTQPASKAEALLRVAPSSLVMAMGPGQRGLDTLARLVDRVPAYWLNWDRDPHEMAQRVGDLLAMPT